MPPSPPAPPIARLALTVLPRLSTTNPLTGNVDPPATSPTARAAAAGIAAGEAIAAGPAGLTRRRERACGAERPDPAIAAPAAAAPRGRIALDDARAVELHAADGQEKRTARGVSARTARATVARDKVSEQAGLTAGAAGAPAPPRAAFPSSTSLLPSGASTPPAT